jgi:hypothetical protein
VPDPADAYQEHAAVREGLAPLRPPEAVLLVADGLVDAAQFGEDQPHRQFRRRRRMHAGGVGDAGRRTGGLNDAVVSGGLRLDELQFAHLGERSQNRAGVDVREDDAVDLSQRRVLGFRLHVPDDAPQSLGKG